MRANRMIDQCADERDIGDIRHDTYRNGAALPVKITYDSPADATKPARAVHVAMDPAIYRDFYHNSETPAASYAATLTIVLLAVLGLAALGQFGFLERRVHYR